MPKNNMVERIARTLHDLTLRNGGISRSAQEMRADAAFLIAAMREPNEAMLRAAAAVDLDNHRPASGEEYWRAMIDAALTGD